MVLNWLLKPKEAFMLQTVSPLVLQLTLFLMTAVATHLVMSFGQTLRSRASNESQNDFNTE
jgi:hypothetical protein